MTLLCCSVPALYISKEIFQSADSFKSVAEKEAHLRKALVAPTDKISVSKHVFPSARFVEDYWFHPTMKPLRYLEYVGVSVNPEYCVGLRYC